MKRVIHLAIAAALFAAGAVKADADPAKQEKVARELIEAINSSDTARQTAYLKAHYINADSASARERWQGHFARYHQMFGDLKIYKVDVSDPAVAHVICKVSDPRAVNEWMDLGVNFDSANNNKFSSMSGGSAFDPSIDLPDRPLTDPELADIVRKHVESMVKRDVFSGTVIIAKDGVPFFSGAYGKADLRWGIDNQLDTKFNLGSMNKMFTGVAICQLASQEKLSFTDPIGKYLPDHPNQTVREKVTIHHLLTHTSGMASYWDAMDAMDWTGLRSVSDFADLTLNDSLSFEPGERFQYSNSGPLYLGLIIEKITGMDYHDYIREFVTGPAGMINTDCYHNDQIVPNLAQGYYWDDEDENTRRTNVFSHSARGSAAGGGFSTVEDLQRFAKALYNETLIPSHMVGTLTKGKVDNGPNDAYAYLFSDSRWDGHRTVGHGGGAPGINADLKIFTDLGYTITVMTNYGLAADAVSSFATRLITHGRPAPEKTM